MGILEIAQKLLRYCREHERVLRYLHPSEYWQPRERIRKKASTLFRRADAEELDEAEVWELLELLEQCSRQHPPPLVAHAVVLGLDDALHSRLHDMFRGRRSFDAGPNDLIPVLDVPCRGALAGELNSDPHNIDVPFDGTRYLQLMPDELEHVVTFSYELDDALARLDLHSPIGVGLPNGRITTDVRESELCWERYTRNDCPLFRNVRATDEQEQRRRLLDLVDQAVRNGLYLMILPELAVTPDLLDTLQEALQVHQRRLPAGTTLPAIVAGSCHMKDDKARLRNRSWLLLPHEKYILHDKFETFFFPDRRDDNTEPEARRFEDIYREPAVRIFVSGSWSWLTLICKDAMPSRILNLITTLRPKLVVVPAMSPKTQVFDTNARSFATHVQTTTIVANAADEDLPGAQVVAVSRPRKEEQLFEALHRSDVTPPCLVLLDVDRGLYSPC
jgi:predicted amidohydrolase